ncbi:hypothetical protein V8D89_001172 [Ganoderma adspersum]
MALRRHHLVTRHRGDTDRYNAQEVSDLDSKITGSLLVYAFSRYALLINGLLVIASSFPTSNLGCTANMWAQTVIPGILGTMPVSAFSALRAYALSNRNIWLTAMIILLALAPPVVLILWVGFKPSQSPWFSHGPPIVSVVFRGSQFAAELLVIGITWWYTYQSYRIRRSVDLGRTLGSLLLYNGSLYFLFLAALYIVDVILRTASVPVKVFQAVNFMTLFYDSITSILICRFMLSLREFESAFTSTTFSVSGSQVRDHATSTVLEFAMGARSSRSLPPFIMSFAHPVHADSALLDMDSDAIVGGGCEWEDTDVVTPTRATPSPSRPSSDATEYSV